MIAIKEIEEIKEMWQDHITDEQRDMRYFSALLELVKKMEGKPVSKRIATAFQQKFPELTVYWSDNHNYHLSVWGGDIPSGKRVEFYFGDSYSGSRPDISVERFEYDNARHGSAAQERNREREVALAQAGNSFDNALVQLIEDVKVFNSVKERIDHTLSALPDNCRVKEILGIYDERR